MNINTEYFRKDQKNDNGEIKKIRPSPASSATLYKTGTKKQATMVIYG